jgi:hypothetical protein
VLALLAVVAAAAVAVPVLDVLAELARVVLIAAAVILGPALAAGLAFAVYRVRHPAPAPPWRAAHLPPAARPAEPLSARRRPAIERARELHLHIHAPDAEPPPASFAT